MTGPAAPPLRAGPVLELRGIVKRFGSVQALGGADFVLHAGEVHGLLGENGAGKSTLMHVAAGLVHPDAGELRIRDTPVRMASPLMARRLGIGMVHQHFTAIPTLTVAENLELARPERGRAGRRGNASSSPAEAVRNDLLAGLPMDRLAEELPLESRQRLEILQALANDADVLLLDEPTAALAPESIEKLLRLLRTFADAGGAVVLISHKLREVFAASDRVTVLRLGDVVLTEPTSRTSPAKAAQAMIGEPRATLTDGELVVPHTGVEDIGHEPGRAPAALREPLDEPGSRHHARPSNDVRARAGTLVVREGEIVGIAAVEGNGQRELLRSLAGIDGGIEVETGGPVAFIPEDRTTEGLIPGFTLTENLVLGLPRDPRWARGVWLRWPAAQAQMAELIDRFGIRAPGPTARARTLSGGNQQKVVFARALERRPALLIAENPTRGLDFRSTGFVHDRLREVARAGGAVVVHSTDLDEVLELATRVVVMFHGKVREVPPGASRREIGALMLGGDP